jgi:hypothetical protein
MTVRVCQANPALAHSVERTQDTAELRAVGLEAVRTAGRDTLCAMAVQAAARDGVDVNTGAEGADGEDERWLMVAAQAGLVETLRALVEAGADVSHANQLGYTALDVAGDLGHVEIIRALIEAGAEVNHADTSGCSALIGAAEAGHVEALKALVEAGAEVNHASQLGYTALRGAAVHGHVEALRALVKFGAEVNHADMEGCTALYAAVFNGQVCARRPRATPVDELRRAGRRGSGRWSGHDRRARRHGGWPVGRAGRNGSRAIEVVYEAGDGVGRQHNIRHLFLRVVVEWGCAPPARSATTHLTSCRFN